jgi:hypothetical protein
MSDRVQFRRGKPVVNVMHTRSSLRGDMRQDLQECAKTQVRDFAPPQGLHAMEVQRLQDDRILSLTELMRQVPMERLAQMSYPPIDTGQIGLRPSLTVRTVPFAGQLAAGLGNALQPLLERLWRVSLGAIAASEVEDISPKSKPALLPVMTLASG